MRKKKEDNGNTQCKYYDISGNDSDSDACVEPVPDYWEEPEGSVDVQGHVEVGTLSLSGTHGPEDGSRPPGDPVSRLFLRMSVCGWMLMLKISIQAAVSIL